MPSPAGTAATAEFGVSLTPDEADIGASVRLLSGSLLRVTDAKTRATIEAEVDALTTDLPQDKTAAGKGVVIE